MSQAFSDRGKLEDLNADAVKAVFATSAIASQSQIINLHDPTSRAFRSPSRDKPAHRTSNICQWNRQVRGLTGADEERHLPSLQILQVMLRTIVGIWTSHRNNRSQAIMSGIV